MRYLIDTNIFSELLREQPEKKVFDQFQKHERDLVTASVVYHELLFGCRRLKAGTKKQKKIMAFIEEWIECSIPILPYDSKAAAWHAEERARLAVLGKTPSFVDGQIAAIAKTNHAIVVTRNVKDFEVFQGVVVENWLE